MFQTIVYLFFIEKSEICQSFSRIYCFVFFGSNFISSSVHQLHFGFFKVRRKKREKKDGNNEHHYCWSLQFVYACMLRHRFFFLLNSRCTSTFYTLQSVGTGVRDSTTRARQIQSHSHTHTRSHAQTHNCNHNHNHNSISIAGSLSYGYCHFSHTHTQQSQQNPYKRGRPHRYC